VFNQFTEQFTINELADKVVAGAATLGVQASIQHIPDPRVESEEHYYNAKHSKLVDLGLKPNLLSDVLITDVLVEIQKYKDRIDPESVYPTVKWNQGSQDVGAE
jgi:UDP-sulfoquinovose synthase